MATITSTITTSTAFITNSDIKDTAAITSAKLAQRPFLPSPIPLTDLRQTGSLATPLAATASNPNMGLYGGTFGTDDPYAGTEDFGAAGAITRRARFQTFLPPNYEDGESFTIRFDAGMVTTVADTSATIDLIVHKVAAGAIGSDLCATAAQDMNSLTFANYDFTITPTGLAAGDVFDCEVTIAANDAATGPAVIAAITRIIRLCDTRG